MLRTAARRARKALSVPQYYGGGLFKSFSTDPVFLWAQAIAFKTFVTLLPLLLLAAGIFGLVVSGGDSMETVTGFLRTFLPPSQADGLIELVFALQEASGGLTILGAAAFLFTVITLSRRCATWWARRWGRAGTTCGPSSAGTSSTCG